MKLDKQFLEKILIIKEKLKKLNFTFKETIEKTVETLETEEID